MWEYDSKPQTLITIDSFVCLTMLGRAHGRTWLGADAKINLATVLIGATGIRAYGVNGAVVRFCKHCQLIVYLMCRHIGCIVFVGTLTYIVQDLCNPDAPTFTHFA